MLDSTFWIFFSVFFTVWIGCVPLFYYAAKKFMNPTGPEFQREVQHRSTGVLPVG